MLTYSSLFLKSTGHFLQCSKLKPLLHKMFVYGTLKKNEPNHYWLTEPSHGLASFMGEGTTKKKYPLIIAKGYNYPFLLYSPGNGYHVKGEVYEIDENMLNKLDILEDHPNYYTRENEDIEVFKGDTKLIETCWVYFLKSFDPEYLTRPRMESYSSSGSNEKPSF